MYKTFIWGLSPNLLRVKHFPEHGGCCICVGMLVDIAYDYRGNLGRQLFKIILFPHVNVSHRIETFRRCFEIFIKNVVIVKL